MDPLMLFSAICCRTKTGGRRGNGIFSPEEDTKAVVQARREADRLVASVESGQAVTGLPTDTLSCFSAERAAE